MPITQSRMIDMINVATAAIKWGSDIKAAIEIDGYNLEAYMHRARDDTDAAVKDEALKAAADFVHGLLQVISMNPLAPELRDLLVAERTHFTLSAKRNAGSAAAMRRLREMDDISGAAPKPKANEPTEAEMALAQAWQEAEERERAARLAAPPAPIHVNPEPLIEKGDLVEADIGSAADVNAPGFLRRKRER